MPEKGIERNPSRAPERKNAEGALPRPSERTAGKETERTTVRLPERSSHQDRSLSRNEKRNPSRRDSISPVRSEEQASKKRTLSTALQEDELSQGIIRGKLSTQPDCQGVKDMRKKLKSNKEQEEKIPPIVSQNYTVYQNTETPSNKTYHSTNPITYQPLRLPSRTIGTAFSEGSSQSSTGQKPKNPASLDLLHKSDLLKAHPLHTALLNAEQRRQWDIPAINMLELGRRIMEMNAEQKRELIQLLQANAHSKIAFKTDPTTGRRLMNLYSLGTDLLQKMWDLTEDQSPVPPLHVEQLTEKDPLISLFPEFFGLVKGAEYPAVWNKFNTKKKLDKGKQPDRGEQPVTESSSSYVRRPVNERNTSYEKRPVPENKSAYEKKPSCENKTISENRPADERKSSYEKRLKPVPEYKPVDERKNYSYEKKPVPEYKPVDERKPSYEKKFVPGNRPADERKSSYERNPVPENKTAYEKKSTNERKPATNDKYTNERRPTTAKKSVIENQPIAEKRPSAADKGKQPMTKDKGKQLFGPGEYINDSRNVLLSDSDFDSLASDIEEGLIDESAENPLDPLFGDESSEEGQIKDDDDLFPTNKNSESAQEGFINSQVVRYQVGRSKPDEEVNVHPSYPFQNRQYQLNRHLSDVASDSDDSSQYSDL
ncbi:hypothetical protein BDB01DRAFT_807475 [Pilobolus umbonatus]|nr:hypothetical protein BDB01DRAFT_807475 [Pilobolus umbonatus]